MGCYFCKMLRNQLGYWFRANRAAYDAYTRHWSSVMAKREPKPVPVPRKKLPEPHRYHA